MARARVGRRRMKAALLERRDQPVDAGLGAQVQRLLHLVEGRGDAILLESFVDEVQEIVFACASACDPLRAACPFCD